MIKVHPNYLSIEFARCVAEPWIDLLSGCEWGEVASALHYACHPDYGFSDEDCALFATKLLENIIVMVEEGHVWDFVDDTNEVSKTQEKCREVAEYWVRGGNLGTNWDKEKVVEETLNSLPEWIFAGEIDDFNGT